MHEGRAGGRRVVLSKVEKSGFLSEKSEKGKSPEHYSIQFLMSGGTVNVERPKNCSLTLFELLLVRKI
jgi:hypothetical protein